MVTGNGVKHIERYSGGIDKPVMICAYNSYMGVVDKCDQFLSYCSVDRKSMKWWKKVFFRLFELSIVNAMVLYFEKYPEMSHKRSSHRKIEKHLFTVLCHHYLTFAITKKSRRRAPGHQNEEYQARQMLLLDSLASIILP